jgi:energy-coupling factor transport system permease protein
MLDYLIASQVIPTDSPLHRLDPRTRLLGFVALLGILIGSGHIGTVTLTLGVTLALVLLARVPLGFATQGLRRLLPWLLLIILIQLLFGMGNRPGCAPLVDLGLLRLTGCALSAAALTLMRFAGLVLLVSLFSWTMPIPSLVHGMEGLASPLIRLGLPIHSLVLTGVIAVRFLPTMALELERLQKAQIARGADLGEGRGGFIKRVRRTLPMIVPLFVLALERAERLAEAMEARAYSGGRGRTQRAAAQLKFRRADWLAMGLLLLLVLFVLMI